jgi:hypothetical protein
MRKKVLPLFTSRTTLCLGNAQRMPVTPHQQTLVTTYTEQLRALQGARQAHHEPGTESLPAMQAYTNPMDENFPQEIGGSGKPSGRAHSDLPGTISARVTSEEKAAFAERARQLHRSQSELAREILFRNLSRMAAPPQVPPVNREAWLRLAGPAQALGIAVRAIESNRSAAVDHAAAHAAANTAALVTLLRHLPAELATPGIAIATTVEDALQSSLASVRELNAILHACLCARADDIDPAHMEQVRQAALECADVLRDVRQLLLGGGVG